MLNRFFISRSYVEGFFKGKTVAIVASGPGALDNAPGFVDSHDIVVRINSFKCINESTGKRCDVHYSFFGSSIHKTPDELTQDGVKLVLCKCPNAKFIESAWHRKMNKPHGVDFQYIYKARANWWFCPTYVPSREEFIASFDLLSRHIPSTGFSALLLIGSCAPASIYLTGFDFFSSEIHNLDEPWRPGNPDDPIGHAPELERRWLAKHLDCVTMDKRLTEILSKETTT